jgi:thiol-disulfide isomerase/thioredoxin/uncharacterized membrane protein YphA (DoxX/SURF4 family)
VSSALIVARLGLALVFAVAGATKLIDHAGSRDAFVEFGLRRPGAAALARVLPLVELALAVLLVLAPTAQYAAGAAALLLVVFDVAIARVLRQGRAPECHCFGQAQSQPVGPGILVRNGVLAAVGLFVLIGGPGPSLTRWLSDTSAQGVALAATAALAGALAYASLLLWRENRRLRNPRAANAIRAVQQGDAAPAVELVEPGGTTWSAPDMWRGNQAVVMFMSSGCQPCIGLLPQVARWRQMLEGRLAIHVVVSGDQAVVAELRREHDVPLLYDDGARAVEAFGVSATPGAVEIDPQGRVAVPPVAGAPAVEALIRAALRRPDGAAQLRVIDVPASG